MMNSIKFRKLKSSIKYSVDGKHWYSYFDGTETEVNNTWVAMQCEYCNDDFMKILQTV